MQLPKKRLTVLSSLARSSIVIFWNTSSLSWGGITAGTGEACRLREKNARKLLQDNVSANVFVSLRGAEP